MALGCMTLEIVLIYEASGLQWQVTSPLLRVPTQLLLTRLLQLSRIVLLHTRVVPVLVVTSFVFFLFLY